MGHTRLTDMQQRGSITALVLVMMIVLAVILAASMQFIARQSHQTIVQEQEEQAFAAAEAGIQHVLWLLHPDGGGYTVDTLHSSQPASLRDHPLTTAGGDVLAYFTVTTQTPTGGRLKTRSEGRDASLQALCQTIDVEVAQVGSAVSLVSWNHRPTTECGSGSTVAAIKPLRFVAGQPTVTVQERVESSQVTHHTYAFAGVAGEQVQLQVVSEAGQPYVILRDTQRVELATAGYGAVTTQTRLAYVADTIGASLRAVVGQPVVTSSSCASPGVTCLPEATGAAEGGQWFELPADGVYYVDVVLPAAMTTTYELRATKW